MGRNVLKVRRNLSKFHVGGNLSGTKSATFSEIIIELIVKTNQFQNGFTLTSTQIDRVSGGLTEKIQKWIYF